MDSIILAPELGLLIFTRYKDSMKGWIEYFIVVELKENSKII